MELQNYCFFLNISKYFYFKMLFFFILSNASCKRHTKSRYTHVPRDPNTYNYMKKPLQASLPLIAITGAKVLHFFESHNR